MSKIESIARYNLIIKILRKRPATFEEIANYLALESEFQGYDFNISKRTFQRDCNDILSLYNMEILYDYSKKVYCIDLNAQAEMNERILEAYDVFNALSLTDRLSKYLHFEKRKPQGTEYLNALLHAIKHRFQIGFSYHKFGDNELTKRIVAPYALKEFKYRWYLLAKDYADQQVKSFALDRLSDLEISKVGFEYPMDFDVNEHFKYSFGIISANESKPEVVILSFVPIQGKYIKSLPLHESQQILIDNDIEFRVQLTVYLTHDFLMELLSYGENLKVIQPSSLVESIKSTFKNALKQYDEI